MFARVSSLFLAAGLVLSAGSAVAGPERVVSMNLCSDHLLLALADVGQIASLTRLGAQQESGEAAEATRRLAAAGLPLNSGLAEEILPLAPDLILAGAFSARPAAALLRRQGLRVVDLPFARSLADIEANIREVAGLIGQEARGAALITDFRRQVAALAPGPGKRPKVAVLTSGLRTQGAGTLVDDLLDHAGLANKAADWGIEGYGTLAMEQILSDPPEAIVIALDPSLSPSLQAGMLTHPALRALATSRPGMTIDSATWVCGSPRVLEALAQLRAFAETLDGNGAR